MQLHNTQAICSQHCWARHFTKHVHYFDLGGLNHGMGGECWHHLLTREIPSPPPHTHPLPTSTEWSKCSSQRQGVTDSGGKAKKKKVLRAVVLHRLQTAVFICVRVCLAPLNRIYHNVNFRLFHRSRAFIEQLKAFVLLFIYGYSLSWKKCSMCAKALTFLLSEHFRWRSCLILSKSK